MASKKSRAANGAHNRLKCVQRKRVRMQQTVFTIDCEAFSEVKNTLEYNRIGWREHGVRGGAVPDASRFEGIAIAIAASDWGNGRRCGNTVVYCSVWNCITLYLQCNQRLWAVEPNLKLFLDKAIVWSSLCWLERPLYCTVLFLFWTWGGAAANEDNVTNEGRRKNEHTVRRVRVHVRVHGATPMRNRTSRDLRYSTTGVREECTAQHTRSMVVAHLKPDKRECCCVVIR